MIKSENNYSYYYDLSDKSRFYVCNILQIDKGKWRVDSIIRILSNPFTIEPFKTKKAAIQYADEKCRSMMKEILSHEPD